jgi:DNA-binding MarR family transcriptional regulator
VEKEEAVATKAEERILRAIHTFNEPPSMRELGEATGISSTQAHAHVCGLEAKGYLKRGPKGASRTIKLTRRSKR